MRRFEIYSADILIGWSELEKGDAPMGVAFGWFLPGPGYDSVGSLVVATSEGDQSALNLSVGIAGQAERLVCVGGVRLVDFSAELGDEGRDVEVGIAYPQYEQLFP